MKFLVTGGAGFIGSALVRFLVEETGHSVLNLDKLTYAGNLDSLASVAGKYQFIQGDICDAAMVKEAINTFAPDRIIHLAAESHVDRSVDCPDDFVQTNVVGTSILLNAARAYHVQRQTQQSSGEHNPDFLFHHVSTDEVYGSLGTDGYFSETTPYNPRSPYSASKAASDHLVRAWGETYGLPIIITNCSNNYGHYQFPEKLIPLIILNAIEGKSLPVYGDGSNIRDWLYVDDHIRALYLVATTGKPGQTYNIGGNTEKTNLEIVKAICDLLQKIKPREVPYHTLITHVPDRPGHDFRYAIDSSKIRQQLGWQPLETFESGLRKTIHWYLENQPWCETVSGNYRERQGLGHLVVNQPH